MIVDTNVLLRSLDRSDQPQTRAVHKRIARARQDRDRLAVMSATVLEVAYVLESPRTGYGWDRRAVADAVTAIADEPAFQVEHGAALRSAAQIYRDRAIDLHDCLLAATADAGNTKVLTFDDDFRRLGVSERP